MIWLRHEIWEDYDGLGYRVASRTETDRKAETSPEAVLGRVFYAPSPAAAKAQYAAVRDLSPYAPGRSEPDAAYTLAQLQIQLRDYPDDEILIRQSVLHQTSAVSPAIVDQKGSAVVPFPTSASVNAVETAPPERPSEPAAPPRWVRRRRKPRVLPTVLRLLFLVIVVVGIAVFFGVVSGRLDLSSLPGRINAIPGQIWSSPVMQDLFT